MTPAKIALDALDAVLRPLLADLAASLQMRAIALHIDPPDDVGVEADDAAIFLTTGEAEDSGAMNVCGPRYIEQAVKMEIAVSLGEGDDRRDAASEIAFVSASAIRRGSTLGGRVCFVRIDPPHEQENRSIGGAPVRSVLIPLVVEMNFDFPLSL